MASKKLNGEPSRRSDRIQLGAGGTARVLRDGKLRPAWAPSDIDFLIAVSGLDLPGHRRHGSKRKK